MKLGQKLKRMGYTIAVVTSTTLSSQAYAGTSGITDPLKTSNDTVASVTNNGLSYAVDAIAMVSGGWFLFHLYKAIMSYAANSKNAQKREEAKGHLIHVGVSGVLLGGAVVFASALFNFGSKLGS